MRGVAIPEKTEDFTADPVELFFDLAFVFAFSQLVARLIHDPTWEGVGEAALLFLLLWLPWTQFTWSANAVSGNGRVVRALFLVGTAASVPMAASVTTAFEGGGLIFAMSLASILVLALAMLTLSFDRGTAQRGSAARYSAFNVAGMLVLVVGGLLTGQARIVAWALAFLTVLAGTKWASRGAWIVRIGHFAERHGLIIIVALGEVIVAIAAPVVGELEEAGGLSGPTLGALIGVGAFGGLLWWSYFDRPSPAWEHRFATLDDRARAMYVRDVYTYAHAPTVAGIILSAAALEEIALHPTEPLPGAFATMLGCGLALYLTGVIVGIGRSHRTLVLERLVAMVLLVGLLPLTRHLDGVVVLVGVDVLLLATLVAEHLRVEGRSAVEARRPGGRARPRHSLQLLRSDRKTYPIHARCASRMARGVLKKYPRTEGTL